VTPRRPRTVGEHLAAIRAIPPARSRWGWSKHATGAEGLRVPAEWILEELPELAGEQLPPLAEYFRVRWKRVTNVGSPTSPLVERVAFHALWGSLIVILFGMAVSAFAQRWAIFYGLMTSLGVWVVVLIVLAVIVGVRRMSVGIPASPGEMIFWRNKTIAGDCAALPINARDIYIARMAMTLDSSASKGMPIARSFFRVAAYLALPTGIVLLTGAWAFAIPALLCVAMLDFALELQRGASALACYMAERTQIDNIRRIVALKRLGAAYPRRGLRLILGRRWRLHAIWRRFRRSAHQLDLLAASLIARGPIVLAMPALLVFALVSAFILPLAIPQGLCLIAALALFVAARSPFPARYAAPLRHALREHLAEFDRAVRFFLAHQRREIEKKG